TQKSSPGGTSPCRPLEQQHPRSPTHDAGDQSPLVHRPDVFASASPPEQRRPWEPSAREVDSCLIRAIHASYACKTTTASCGSYDVGQGEPLSGRRGHESTSGTDFASPWLAHAPR